MGALKQKATERFQGKYRGRPWYFFFCFSGAERPLPRCCAEGTFAWQAILISSQFKNIVEETVLTVLIKELTRRSDRLTGQMAELTSEIKAMETEYDRMEEESGD